MSLPSFISIQAPSQARVGEPFLVSGSLTATGGAPISNALIHVYANPENEVAQGLTDVYGQYAINVTMATPGFYYLYTEFKGDAANLSAASMVIDLTVSEGGGGLNPIALLALAAIVGVAIVYVTKKS